MNYLVLLCQQVIDFFRLVADAAQRPTSARIIVYSSAVVMAELHQDKIAGLELSNYFIPKSLGHKGTATTSAASAVFDMDFGLVKIVCYRIAPAQKPLPRILHRGIANDKKRR